MNIATKGNVRTAAAARISLQESFKIAFNSVPMGFRLTGLAVLGIAVVYIGLRQMFPSEQIHIIMEILSALRLAVLP